MNTAGKPIITPFTGVLAASFCFEYDSDKNLVIRQLRVATNATAFGSNSGITRPTEYGALIWT